MDTITLALMGAKYIAKLISSSKTFEGVKETTLQKSLTWIKTNVFGRRPQLPQTIEQTNDPVEKEKLLSTNLSELLQEPAFKQEFQRWIEEAQEEPVIKNFFDVTIKEIEGNIIVGDHYKYQDGQPTQRPGQNQAKGNIDKMKGDFRVGDTFEQK
jgi:hypothetical protein